MKSELIPPWDIPDQEDRPENEEMSGLDYRTIREKMGMTQSQLAYAMEITVRTVQRIESSAKIPKRDQLAIMRLKTI